MHEQVINEYYINLKYNTSSREEALTKISTLSKEIHFKDVNDFSDRLLKAASKIEKNLSVFKSVCEHVDTVTTILEYLTNFGVKFMFDNDFDKEYNKEEIILSVVLTIFYICREHEVQLFLEEVIIKNSTLVHKIQYNHLKNELSKQTNEMILLEEADLYAVVNYLTIVGYSCINKIWVQVSIKQKFLSLVKKYFRLKNLHICIWTLGDELIVRTSDNINVVSIWSENIVYAKYLATNIDRDIVFINMHTDLYGGIMLLPWIKVFDKLHEKFKSNFTNSIQPNQVHSDTFSNMSFVSIYNLFYNGKWHKPVKDTYWRHNNSLYASATSDDVRMCLDSAVEGSKVWKNYPISTRICLLARLLSELKLNREDAQKFVKYSQFNLISLLYSQNNRLEVTQIRVPRGVIILKGETKEILFLRLIQILISGNSVIVLTDANSYNLAPYCDTFSLSKIPRGVINVLSNENTRDLELSLCATDYANYEKQFFTFSLEKTYINLTQPKPIIVSLLNNFINDIEYGRVISNNYRDT